MSLSDERKQEVAQMVSLWQLQRVVVIDRAEGEEPLRLSQYLRLRGCNEQEVRFGKSLVR